MYLTLNREEKSEIHFNFIVLLSIQRDQSTNMITNLIIVDSLSKQTQTKKFTKDSFGKALAHELDYSAIQYQKLKTW